MDKNIVWRKTNPVMTEKLAEFGLTGCGVGWNGDEAQRIRYEQLTKLIEFGSDTSICDYGCGYGYYLSYLKEKGCGWSGTYTGYDLSKEMIAAAIKKYGRNDEHHVFINSSEITGSYDYIVSSGVFNLKMDIKENDWKDYMLETIDCFHDHSKKGFAFNALTKYSDPEKMQEDLYYSDPLFLFDYCKKKFSKNVVLLHDYELYDFTIIVRKQAGIKNDY